MRLTISSSQATSLMVVARDIAYALRRQGHIPQIFDQLMDPGGLKRLGEAHITVMTVNPLIASSWMLLVRDLLAIGHPAVFYGTIEGRPVRRHVQEWMRRDLAFIANSRFTAEQLEMEGLRVMGIVPHGVNLDECREARRLSTAVRKKLSQKIGDRKVIGVVATSHPRKGLENLPEIARLVRSSYDDVVFYVMTTPSGVKLLSSAEGVYAEPIFGKLTRVEVLSHIASFDLLLHPAYAEGFGLPVLEANACEVPVVHTAMPPLIEFSSEGANWMVPYTDVRDVDIHEGIVYRYHLYDPKDYASMIIDALECMDKRPSEWEDRRAKAIEAAREYDVVKVYPALLKYLERRMRH